VAALGGFVAAFLGGGVLTLGSFLGFLAILGLASRNGIIQIRRFQDLEQQDAGRGGNLILRGVEERLRAVVASTITTGAIVSPLCRAGQRRRTGDSSPGGCCDSWRFGELGNFRAVRAAGLVSAICGCDRSHDRSVDCGGSLMDAFPTWRTCAMPLKNAAAVAVAMIVAVGLQALAPEARADSPAPPKPESQATIKRLGFGLNQIALLPNAARRLGIQTSEITEKRPGVKIAPYSSIIYDPRRRCLGVRRCGAADLCPCGCRDQAGQRKRRLPYRRSACGTRVVTEGCPNFTAQRWASTANSDREAEVMIRWIVGNSLHFRFIVVAFGLGLTFFGAQRLRDIPIDVFPEFARREWRSRLCASGCRRPR